VSPPRRPLRVGLLENPHSGRNRRGTPPLSATCESVSDLLLAVGSTQVEISDALSAFAKEGVDCVVVSGGDGTVHAVLTSLYSDGAFSTSPLLALLRAGTANMIAGDVGLRGRPPAALRRLLVWARDPERPPAVVDRAVLRMQPAPDAEPLFGMFFGAGAIYDGSRYCVGRLHRVGLRGSIGAALTVVRYVVALLAGRRVPSIAVTSTVDERPAESRALLLCLATTLERLLFGLRPFWGVGEGGLCFTTVAAQPRHLLRALPSLLRGRPGRFGTSESGYVSRNASEVRLVFDGGCMLDGELLTADSRRGPVCLSVGPRASFVCC
jgi:diacylglycerol kinase (ATP)